MRQLFVLLLLLPFAAKAQMILEVSVPEYYMPLLEDLYVAGDFNDWNPGHPDWKLNGNAENGFYISISGQQSEAFDFKFTRGDWDRVEGTSAGNYLPNRSAVFEEGGVLELSIAGWEDFPGNSTASGLTRVLSTRFEIPELNRERRVWIYLPEDYYNSSQDYPVLYMHDAQNLFDAASSFSGEWQVDESLLNLPDDCPQAIVVGIDNGGSLRIDEYSAWVNNQYGGGEADLFALFIKNTLKPFVDENFRTLPEAEHTGVAGSSLGGLLAMYMVLEHSDTFGRAGVFSPSFWFSDGVFELAETHNPNIQNRIFLLGGSNESSGMLPDMQSMRNILLQLGYPEEHIRLEAHTYGQHNEAYWAGEFAEVFKWLFTENPAFVEHPASTRQGEITYPNPSTGLLKLASPLPREGLLRVFDLAGRMRIEETLSPHQIHINLSHLPPGSYVLSLQSRDGAVRSQRLMIQP